jgi:nucleotide-binding universal stress UspA family protein
MNWMPRTSVVVPVDFSDKSFEAVDVGLSLVDEPSHMHVVHVLPDLTTGEAGLVWDPQVEAKRREASRNALADRLSDAKYEGVKTDVLVGNPGSEIASFAKKAEADLIVMPSHGRTGIKRLLIGSVAERVTRLSHCPVLILRE